MAVYYELRDVALEAYREMIRDLQSKAMRELKLGAEGLVVRPLRATDLGLSTPVWSFSIASSSAWNTLINTSIADNRFVGINGVLYGETDRGVVTELKVTRAGDVKRYWPIEDINLLENPAIFFDDPVTVDQNQPIKIEAYATGTGTERITFLGAVVEKKGLLIK